MDTRDRFRGCMVGVAVGDALGGPFEGMPGDEAAKRFDGKMAGGGVHNLKPGEFTDDAGMTLVLAESMVRKKGVALEDIFSRFLEWYKTNPKGLGRLTSMVMEEGSKGAPWQDAARIAWERPGKRSAGNGSLMRFAPVALADCRSRERLMEDASAVSGLTHHDPRCSQACQAASLILVELIDGRTAVDAVRTAVSMLGGTEASRALARSLEIERDEIRPTGYVIDTLEVVCWHMTCSSTFRECIEGCVLLGGDADTNAAVTGALAGARSGIDGIPSEWAHALDANKIGLDGIIELADGLYDVATKRSR